MEYLKLFLTFMKVGAFTFGGGYAMLPLLNREVVEKQGWCTEEELLDYYTIGRCTPGVISVNAATFIGIKQKGLLGGICSTLGIIFPSLVLVTLAAAASGAFVEIPAVAGAIRGIAAAVCAMVTLTVIQLTRKSVVDFMGKVLFVAAFLATLAGVSPVFITVLSGAAGVVLKYREYKK
jgi:chromate transporter